MRDLKDRTKGTSIQTRATVDALRLVNMLDAILVLADRTHRARLLARYRYVDDRMIGAVLVALTAADADIVIDLCLTILLE